MSDFQENESTFRKLRSAWGLYCDDPTLTVEQIAEKVGVTPEDVAKHLKETRESIARGFARKAAFDRLYD